MILLSGFICITLEQGLFSPRVNWLWCVFGHSPLSSAKVIYGFILPLPYMPSWHELGQLLLCINAVYTCIFLQVSVGYLEVEWFGAFDFPCLSCQAVQEIVRALLVILHILLKIAGTGIDDHRSAISYTGYLTDYIVIFQVVCLYNNGKVVFYPVLST